MALEFIQRGHDLKKVLIYGDDKTGKSTFAEEYCKKNNLAPVVIDIDNTNYTHMPILKLNLTTDIAAYKNIKKAIEDVVKDGRFDTLVLDGVSSMLELFVSKAKGLKKYSDRAERFNDILRDLLNSKLNLIFIGQIDMKVVFNEEFQSPKPIIKINSIVNEKYKTYRTKKGFSYKTIACRVWDGPVEQEVPEEIKPEPEVVQEEVKDTNETESKDVFMTAGEIGEPKPEDDPIRKQCIEIKKVLEDEGTKPTKFSMKLKVVKLVKEGVVPEENKIPLLQFIANYCPEGEES